MTSINPVSASVALQHPHVPPPAAAQAPKAPAVNDPDHDGDTHSGGADSDKGTDIKA
jgi:hypothetical protein